MRAPLIFMLLTLATVAAAQTDGLARCAVALDQEDFAAATREAQGYLRLHAESVPARILLARAYMGANNGGAALAELRAAVGREPDSIEALYFISKLTAVLSMQEFGVVARDAPDSARMHQLRAETLEARKDATGAEREYLAALEKRPGTTYILNALGDLKRHEKQYAEALRWYQQVLAKDPDNYDALYGAGASYQLSKQSDKAVPLFRLALKADPSSVAAKMALGEVLLQAKSAAEAVTLLEEAARADPKFRRLQFLLGRAYQMVGRAEDAKRAYERFRALAAREEEEDMPAVEGK